MKQSILLFLGLALLPALPASGAGNELVVCGWDEVFILDLHRPSESTPKKVWTWKAEDRPELPAHMKTKFRTTDECKPVFGGTHVLITASSDGVALVERETGKVTFYASAANAHSAEVLPGRRVAVAASHRNQEGDRLLLFDLDTPEKVLYQDELYSGHGVVWDETRKLLWALSGRDLRAYRLKDWESATPSLEKVASHPLPEGGGHDLYPVAGTPDLTVTTGRHCWLFDRDKRRFRPHPELSAKAAVKCITVHPATGQTVWVQAEGANWWSSKLRFLNPERTVELPGERLYKARWNVEAR